MPTGRSARQRVFCLIAGFLLLGVMLISPGVSYAQVSTVPDCDTISTTAEQDGSQTAFPTTAAELGQFMGTGPMSTSADSCIQTLETLYSTISSLFTGPFDPLGIVRTLITTVINQIIQGILQEVCSLVEQAVSEVINYPGAAIKTILGNLLCLPNMPWFGGPGVPAIPLPPNTCNGWTPFSGTSMDIAGITVAIPPFMSYRFRQ